MKEAIFFTGGAGFIGTALARKLANSNTQILVIDSLHPQVHPEQRLASDFPANTHVIIADVAQPSTWDKILKEWTPTAVVHLAAETGTGQSLTEASRHGHANVLGTTQMTDAFSRLNVKPKHIVLTSSRAVYGEGAWKDKTGTIVYPRPRKNQDLRNKIWNPVHNGSQLISPTSHLAGTTHPCPTSVYGATKLAQEQILISWCDAMDVPLSIFRLQNVYGPGQSPFNSYTGIVTLFHRQAKAKKSIEIYEDGQIGRDFVFIDDVVEALAAGLNKPAVGLRLLDVGSGHATTIEAAARMIAEAYDAPPPNVCGKFRDGDVRWAVADVQRLEDELNVKAKVNFNAGSKLVGAWLTDMGFI
jgi:dTDP-L-rhamnose 4-epimerase